MDSAQQKAVQEIYDAAIKPLIAKYGKGTQFEGADFRVDEDGKVTDVRAHINFILPADPDGDQQRMRKTVSVW